MPQLEIQFADSYYGYCVGGDRDEDADWVLLSPEDSARFDQWWAARGIEVGDVEYMTLPITAACVDELATVFPDTGPGQDVRERAARPRLP